MRDAISFYTLSSFVCGTDGNRVQSTITLNQVSTTTTFVGNYYETDGTNITKYYYAGSSRVAMSVNGTVSYLLSDQLGSTSMTALGDGTKVSELRYKAWGEVRYSNGTTATAYQYTGQYAYASLGLDFYAARFYDPALGRFISADSVVPGGVQGYDRYAYANNSPIVYNDPSGHTGCFGANADDGPQCYQEGRINNKGHNQAMGIKAKTNGCSYDDDGCLLQSRARRSNMPYITGSTSSGSGGQLTALGYLTRYGNQAIQLLTEYGNVGLPLYKQWHGAATLGPGFEGAAGALLQLGSDIDNPNLTTTQKVFRSVVTGFEGAVTETVSEPWAAAGMNVGGALGGSAGEIVGSPIGAVAGGVVGGGAGYEIGSMGATALMDKLLWEPLNEASGLFP